LDHRSCGTRPAFAEALLDHRHHLAAGGESDQAYHRKLIAEVSAESFAVVRED